MCIYIHIKTYTNIHTYIYIYIYMWSWRLLCYERPRNNCRYFVKLHMYVYDVYNTHMYSSIHTHTQMHTP